MILSEQERAAMFEQAEVELGELCVAYVTDPKVAPADKRLSLLILDDLLRRDHQRREAADDPVVLRDSLDGTPLARLSEVNIGQQRPTTTTAKAPPLDAQAVFARLAEQSGGYREAARQHPELWEAARDAASLQGGAATFNEQAARQLAEGE